MPTTAGFAMELGMRSAHLDTGRVAAVNSSNGEWPKDIVRLASSQGANEFSFSAAIEPFGAKVSYARQVEIYGEREPAEYFYKVISGSVRTYKVLMDGRRQVCSFYLPGDFFGWETNGTYSVSGETISD